LRPGRCIVCGDKVDSKSQLCAKCGAANDGLSTLITQVAKFVKYLDVDYEEEDDFYADSFESIVRDSLLIASIRYFLGSNNLGCVSNSNSGKKDDLLSPLIEETFSVMLAAIGYFDVEVDAFDSIVRTCIANIIYPEFRDPDTDVSAGSVALLPVCDDDDNFVIRHDCVPRLAFELLNSGTTGVVALVALSDTTEEVVGRELSISLLPAGGGGGALQDSKRRRWEYLRKRGARCVDAKDCGCVRCSWESDDSSDDDSSSTYNARDLKDLGDHFMQCEAVEEVSERAKQANLLCGTASAAYT